MDVLIKDYHDNHIRELQQTAATERLARSFPRPARRRIRLLLSRLGGTVPADTRPRGSRLHRSDHAVRM